MSVDLRESYDQRLFGRGPGRILPELGRMRRALEVLGRPERDFPSMLLVGTNGKGSTVAMLASILQASGLRVGRYTSPHLVDVRERITVGGLRISKTEFSSLLDLMDDFPNLSFFETLTVMAFVHFSRQKIDVAVLEAGMGGRWDATRSAESGIAGLSSLSMDHLRWLGRSIEEIAADKGAALEAARIGIVAPCVDAGLLPVLGAPDVQRASRWLKLSAGLAPSTCEVRFSDGHRLGLDLPLQGAHQLSNLHLALAMAEAGVSLGWYQELRDEALIRGLGQTVWPGRLSEISFEGRRVLLDGAHNLESSTALARELESRGGGFDLLFSCLNDKPAGEMALRLRPVVKKVVICMLDDERAMDLEHLQKAWPEALVAEDPVSGIGLLGDWVVAAGSLRLVGFLLAALPGREGCRDVG